MRTVRAVVVGATVIGGLVAAGATAGADPQSGFLNTLVCGGTAYDVIVAGNGEFTPAHDLDSTTMFIPTAFGDLRGQIFDASGALVDEFVEEGTTAKGQSGKHKDTITCTYTFTEVSDGSDPEFPAGFTFVGTGEVTAFLTPRSG